MFLLVLFGLFAILFGKVAITKSLRLEGKRARIYGLLLIVLTIPYGFVMSAILSPILPVALAAGRGKVIVDMFLVLLLAVLLMLLFQEKK